jgi:selenocysteine lyase/cysteine desulfurase
MDKRSFLKSAGLFGLAGITGQNSLASLIESVSSVSPSVLASDEAFWMKIRADYNINPDYINLENGYYSIMPGPVLEGFIKHVHDINYRGSYYMRTVQAENKKAMAARLAAIAGCSADELIITRNTTESLDMIIGGYNWKPGDEAVMAEQDYFAMLDMFRQVADRYGVENKIVSIPNHPGSDEEIVNLYANAITPKTKLLMVCHMINITGQILPVRKICDMAHSRGVQVMVDGAHAFGHFKFSIPELNCDYYGSSLHKWMSVPLGSGILYIRKEHIRKIWPLLASMEKDPDSILRLNHTGTHPVHTDLTVQEAIDYYSMLGAERKESRLRYLQLYWTSKVRDMPHIIMNTPGDPERTCAIANVGIRGIRPEALGDILLKKYKIYSAPIDGAGVHGCRITPNIYTSLDELDALVKALTELG